MSLTTYRKKRSFSNTPEPRGAVSRERARRRFVVQKHAARRLHYDLRLEIDGVLKSWAVPKGPSLDPLEKRLAVHVEDHPLEYARFEGVIPAGQYGGGSVIVWDQGEYDVLAPEKDILGAYKGGKLNIELQGNKLQGGWTLVRMGGKRGEEETNWLLIKERDEYARPSEDYDVTQAQPASVLSGRELSEVAQKERLGAHKTHRKRASRSQSHQQRVVGSAQSTTQLPAVFKPQLARLTDQVPSGKEWIHEIKFDGYRLLARLEHQHVSLLTRNHHDWTHRFPELRESLERFAVESAILDGELVAMRPDGLTNFQDLQQSLQNHSTAKLVYQVFDLLFVNGEDLRKRPLLERKTRLKSLLDENPQTRVRYSDHLQTNGAEFFEQGCQRGLEGIISKRADRPYRAGRSDDWLKIKCLQREEFVIGGYTAPSGARQKFGALLLGYFQPRGELVYAGRVGTGFSDAVLHELWARLGPLKLSNNPFEKHAALSRAKAQWTRPELVAQVEFSNWTHEGLLRHPSFQGIREDVPATAVVRSLREIEMATSTKAGRSRVKALAPAEAALRQLEDVRLTSPEKILYPDSNITKLDLVKYYASVADWILPHVSGRPLSLVRCPEGIDGTCFYQKHAVVGTPEQLERVMILEKTEEAESPMVNDLAAIASLVQMSVLEIHPWGARADRIERPDRMIFDLDPGEGVSWSDVKLAAVELKGMLDDLSLVSFVKTTGGKGLHIVVPLERRHTWDDVREFSEAICQTLARASPEKYTANMSKAKRQGRIYLDYVRNNRGATAVAPYSTRARPGAPVATPIDWKELKRLNSADQFRVDNVRTRLAGLKSDPWEEMGSLRQSITLAMRRSVGMASARRKSKR